MRMLGELQDARRRPRGPSSRSLLSFDRRLFEHGADAIVVIREAGRAKPELAEVVDPGPGPR